MDDLNIQNTIFNAIRLGLIYGIGSIGLSLPLRFLKFPDFTSLASIMVGGISCIYFTKLTDNSLYGVLLALLVSGFLGIMTGVLSRFFKIQRVLASIITLTGSYSLGYYLVDKGGDKIDLPLDFEVILESIPNYGDIGIILIVGIVICLLFSFFVKTNLGSLILAMLAEDEYLKFRHKYRDWIFILILFVSNAIVGLSGALSALMTRVATIFSHQEFLPIALGAIFGGNAITLFFTHKLHGFRIDEPDDKYDIHPPASKNPSRKGPKKLLSAFYSIFAVPSLDSKKIGLLYFSYIIGCLFLWELKMIIFTNIEFRLAHFIVALLITLFIWWAGSEDPEA